MRTISAATLSGTILLALSMLTGCAAPAPNVVTPRALIASAKERGIDLADPLAVDPDMVAEVRKGVRQGGPSGERLRTLVRWLNESGRMNFQYTPHRSLTAREAYRERRGDCMAYTNLAVALARQIGIDAYFVHVTEVRNYYERAGWFFVSSHVAVGHGKGPTAVVFDFTKEIADWKLSLYEAIDDGQALALYYNNVAVDSMMAGKSVAAERLLRFLLEREPDVAELHNNLGVLLNRRRRHGEALSVLEQGIARFPAYEPLYTNGIVAARGAGKVAVARDLERRGSALEKGDPFFLFARAMRLYEDRHFVDAAAELERAVSAKPESAVILAWLTRAYLSAGKRAEGAEAYAKARRLAPDEPILRELEQRWPELRRGPAN